MAGKEGRESTLVKEQNEQKTANNSGKAPKKGGNESNKQHVQ